MSAKAPGVFEIRDKDLAGRIGRLHTPHGYLETPALLPVIDVFRQDAPIEVIERLGFRGVITNAYLLWKRMGNVAREKGVHGVLGFNGVVMTDSGAYQILQYGRVDIDPATVIEFQKSIGSDIAVILDIPTGNARSRKQAEYSVRETLRRAKEALSLIDPENRVWTLPVQGGQFLDLVEYSSREASKLIGPYRLLALGSPTVLLERYDYATIIDMVYRVRSNVPRSAPLHLFGAGHPMIIPYAVALGVDLFDSASYILYARDNRIITETRTYRLEELDYMPCSTEICTKYTPKELLEIPRPERVRLLATHNLTVLAAAIRQVKQAIREGRLWELLEERSRSHPSVHRAFLRLIQYSRYLEAHTPRTKGGKAKGVFLYSTESTKHPKLLQHHNMLLSRYRPPRGVRRLLLIPIRPEYRPFTRDPLYRSLRSEDAHVAGYILRVWL
jgi:7-cyano-7-deazaguanine tRNA-ribosyltransferase